MVKLAYLHTLCVSVYFYQHLFPLKFILSNTPYPINITCSCHINIFMKELNWRLLVNVITRCDFNAIVDSSDKGRWWKMRHTHAGTSSWYCWVSWLINHIHGLAQLANTDCEPSNGIHTLFMQGQSLQIDFSSTATCLVTVTPAFLLTISLAYFTFSLALPSNKEEPCLDKQSLH